MTQVDGPWLRNAATQTVARMLTDAGYQAYFVGGCVRNALMGKPVSDIDMTSDAHPDQVSDLAQSAGLKVIPTGLDHGTLTVISGTIPHEITTFRRDVTTDGRHAQIAFSDTISQDAQRRDFTMNALYADANGTVSDPTHGLPDLVARRVRFVGDPARRITEDSLRILRFFRFHAWYGDPSLGLDADGLAACATGLEGLDTLSRERIGAEMTKLLGAPDPAPAIAAMHQSGVLSKVMPGADPKALALLVHFETDAPNWIARAAVMGGDDLRDNWRMSKKVALYLNRLRTLIGAPASLSEIAYRDGPQMARDAALTRAAVFETHPDAALNDCINIGAQATFPIKAVDLPDLKGAALGQKLRALETAWIASNFALSKEALLAL